MRSLLHRTDYRRYAGEFMRRLTPNLRGLHLEIERKATAFFKYMQYAANMVCALHALERNNADLTVVS